MTKMSLIQKAARLRVRLQDPEWRRFGTLLLTGKLTAVGILLLAALVLNPGLLGLRTFAADPVLKGQRHREPDQHGVDAGRRVPGFGMQVGFTMLEAGLLPLARNRQRADGVHCRHVPLRHPLLRLRIRVHVQPWQRLHRAELVLPERRAGDV